MRSNIKKVFLFYLSLFSILILYILILNFVEANKIKLNPNNPRLEQITISNHKGL